MKRKLCQSSGPYEINEDCWYYEDYKEGIEIIYEVRIGGQYVQTDHIKIPWKLLSKSMERYVKRLEEST